MTYFGTQTPSRPVLPAVIAGIALILAGVLSVGGLNIFGARYGFGFCPLIVIAIWPRQAHNVLSVFLIFLAGIFTDWATAGVVGQWSLTLVVTWALMRPELRSEPFSPMSFGLIWFGICCLAVLLLTLSGRFVFGLFPDFSTFARQALIATLFLPVIMLLRAPLARLFSDGDEWDR